MIDRNSRNLVLSFGLGLLFVGVLTRGFGLGKSNPTSSTTTNQNGFVSVSLSDITGDAKWYEYNSGSGKVRFFAVKASDGTVKTAFDACDVCYTEGKGYRQEGDHMICNNCGNRYPIAGLGTENKTPGGCWPGYLPNTIEGDTALIRKSDLEGGQR